MRRWPRRPAEVIASFTGLIVNPELASIWQRAIVLKEVQLDAPDVNLVVERDGSINLAHLVPDEAAPSPAADAATAPLPRIRIGRLAVNDGRVDFEDADRARPAPFTATLSPIRFALEFSARISITRTHISSLRAPARAKRWSGPAPSRRSRSVPTVGSPWGSWAPGRSIAICRASCRYGWSVACFRSREPIDSRCIRR